MDYQERDWFGDILISPEIVLLNMEAASDMDAIDQLASHLYGKGIVKESYIPAVKQREVDFCTGLAFKTMGVALPHTDSIHVNQQAVAIGVLKEPVPFHAMGMPEEIVDVSMLFMLAIQKPDAEIAFLGKMIEILQEDGCLETIRNAPTPEETARVFRGFFEENESGCVVFRDETV